MPAIAHIGIGFAAKKAAPAMNVFWLIVAAEFVEIIFMLLWGLGVEHPPTDTSPPFSPISHSLVMGLLWSILAVGVVFLFSRKRRLSLIIGFLVLSHTVLDFIASPKTAFYPADTGMPFFMDYTSTYGLGLWENAVVAAIGEIGILAAGVVIYIMAIRKIKAEGKFPSE